MAECEGKCDPTKSTDKKFYMVWGQRLHPSSWRAGHLKSSWADRAKRESRESWWGSMWALSQQTPLFKAWGLSPVKWSYESFLPDVVFRIKALYLTPRKNFKITTFVGGKTPCLDMYWFVCLFLFILIFNILFIVDSVTTQIARVILVPLYLFSDRVLADFFNFFIFKGWKEKGTYTIRKKIEKCVMFKGSLWLQFSFLY